MGRAWICLAWLALAYLQVDDLVVDAGEHCEEGRTLLLIEFLRECGLGEGSSLLLDLIGVLSGGSDLALVIHRLVLLITLSGLLFGSWFHCLGILGSEDALLHVQQLLLSGPREHLLLVNGRCGLYRLPVGRLLCLAPPGLLS